MHIEMISCTNFLFHEKCKILWDLLKTGINAVVFFTVRIFEAAGTTLDSNLCSIIVGVVLLVSITVSAFLSKFTVLI